MSNINVDEIKARHDIVDIVSKYVDIKKQGKDWFGCCPFHGERTASFTVNERDQYFHCFGCGANGDVIKFLMDITGSNFVGVAEMLGHQSAMNPHKAQANIVKSIQRKIRLPFNKEPVSTQDIASFLGRCKKIDKPDSNESIYYYDGTQVLLMTDLHKNPASLCLVKQGYQTRFMNKKFLHGTCVINGDLTGDVYLCEDWHKAINMHLTEGKNTVCFFDPHNLYFMQDELKRRDCNLIVMAKTEETLVQADKFNLLDCYMGGMKVNLNLIEGYLNV